MTTTTHPPEARRLVCPDFLPLLEPFDLDAFDEQDATIYGVRDDLTLAYVNATWVRFAIENNGPRCLTDPDQILGTPILEKFSGPLRRLYQTIFERVLGKNDSYEQDYECSSPREFRRYHMTIRPLPADSPRARGLLVINSVVRQREMKLNDEPVQAPDPDDYIDDDGQVVSCSNCRRFRHVDDNKRWDWVPDYLTNPPAPVSHGLCDVCLDYFYPKPVDEQPD